MLAGIGAFWSIFGAICSLAFIIGGFIALKKGSFELQEKIKGEERETLPPSEDVDVPLASATDVADEIKDPLAFEQAGESVFDGSTNRK